MNIAVFGDLHGHLRLMLQLCRIWQHENNTQLDGVLQCGDLGYFPYPSRIDKATRRYVERKKIREELGFSDYFRLPKPPKLDTLAEMTLGPNGSGLDQLFCPIYWVNGNHEDFGALAELHGGSPIIPVDYYDKLLWLRSGNITEIAQLKIAGVGGGVEDAPKNTHNLMGIQEEKCTRLWGQSFDLLISHVGPKNIGGETDIIGSRHLRDLDEIAQPAYHFFAHHGRRIEPARIGETQCYWLDDVGFGKSENSSSHPINKRCMGILNWHDRNHHRFDYVDNSWFKATSDINWLRWKPTK